MATYGIPPTRRNDFFERYSRMRNPETVGGSRILRVEEPYVNGRPGAVLAERNWKGEPVSRGGVEGPDIVDLGLNQLVEDQAPPMTDFSARDLPGGGTVYTRRPFEAMTGRTNFTPYGTISSRPENEEERIAREWNQYVTQGQPIEPTIVQQAPAPGVLENAQMQGRLARDMAMTPGTPENEQWQRQENTTRAMNGLGPVETAYEDFVADQDTARNEDALSRDLYNAARRQEREARTEQGRRLRNGEMVPTRSSAISPGQANRLRQDARQVARQILSGANPEETSRAYQNLTRSAVAGAPVPMSPEERYNEQQSRESATRLRLGENQNERAQKEFEQEQADRKEFQDSLLKWQDAQTEADRNRVIRDSPALQKYFGVRLTQDEGVTQRQAEFAQESLKGLLRGRSEDKLSPDERQQAETYRGMIAQYTQNEAKRLGIQPAAAIPEKKTLTREQAKEFLKQAGGDKQKARALATEAGYSF